MNVRFCPSCRSLILSSFRFCPYCGEAIKGPELSEALASPFERIGRAEAGDLAPSAPRGSDPFARAAESLDRLEADMDLILEELAKEGRSH
jgi:hypothetical protein